MERDIVMDGLIGLGIREEPKTNPKRWVPKVGDRVELKSSFYDGVGGKEIKKLARLPYCTVESVHPIAMSKKSGDPVEWFYEIYVKETGYMVGISYKKFKG